MSAEAVSDAMCSSRACKAPATWALIWRNPKLHTPDRRKVWVACDDHRDTLGEFLEVRGLLLNIEPLNMGSVKS